ncbi:MAG: T9SS type A sorting domain-containing protein [Bacteroidia bacterium]
MPGNTVPCIVDLIDSLTVFVCDSIANPTPSPDTGFTFSIYPNPGQVTVTLNFTSLQEDVIMYIYDARGRLVLKQNIAKGIKTMELNIANLASGVYVLKLQNSEIKEVRKIIKT